VQSSRKCNIRKRHSLSNTSLVNISSIRAHTQTRVVGVLTCETQMDGGVQGSRDVVLKLRKALAGDILAIHLRSAWHHHTKMCIFVALVD
jgi:hypothetical protein